MLHKYQLVVVVIVLCAPMLLARREGNQRDNRRLDKQAARKCAYQWSECRFEGGATCGTNGKKVGTSDQPDCRQQEKKCRVKCPVQPASASGSSSGGAAAASNCKYKTSKGGDNRATCDPKTNKKPVTQTLVSGGAGCQKTITTYKPCRPRQQRDTTGAGADDSRCKYRKGQKGECNPTTNKRTITLNLKRKSPSSCPATKTVEKPCKAKQAKQTKPDRRRPGNKQNRRQQEQMI